MCSTNIFYYGFKVKLEFIKKVSFFFNCTYIKDKKSGIASPTGNISSIGKVSALTATSSVAENVSAHNTAATAVQNGYQYGSSSGGTSPVMPGGTVTGIVTGG